MKLNKSVIWHEFGHLFGYKLVERLGSSPHTIVEFKFHRINGQNPYIKTNSTDFIRLDGEKFEDSLIRIKKNLNFNNGFYYQIIIYLMGAVFELDYIKGTPNEEDFKKIFTNIDTFDTSEQSVLGHAGSDFTKIKIFLMDYKQKVFKEITIMKFALNLHQLLKKFEIFVKLFPLVEKFNNNYNGLSNKGEGLFEDELSEINMIIEDELIELINKEISFLKTNSEN